MIVHCAKTKSQAANSVLPQPVHLAQFVYDLKEKYAKWNKAGGRKIQVVLVPGQGLAPREYDTLIKEMPGVAKPYGSPTAEIERHIPIQECPTPGIING